MDGQGQTDGGRGGVVATWRARRCGCHVAHPSLADAPLDLGELSRPGVLGADDPADGSEAPSVGRSCVDM